MDKVDMRDPEQWLPRELFAAYCGPGSDKLLAYYDKAKAKRQLVTFDFNWFALLFVIAWFGYRRQWVAWAILTGAIAASTLIEGLAHVTIPPGAFGGTLLVMGLMAHGFLLSTANGLYLKLKRQGVTGDALTAALAGKARRSVGLGFAALFGAFAINVLVALPFA